MAARREDLPPVGGPHVRYPTTPKTLRDDLVRDDRTSYVPVDDDDFRVAFGLLVRHDFGRVHLARLIYSSPVLHEAGSSCPEAPEFLALIHASAHSMRAVLEVLVELHGGSVYVKSAAGKGATFGFTLPSHYTSSHTPDEARLLNAGEA